VTRRPRWSVGIVVPARDEAELVGRCVASILRAALPAGVERWIVVVADGCADQTAPLAARALDRSGEIVSLDARRVGAARRAGAQAAVTRFRGAGRAMDRVWLLSTDADSTVPHGWIDTYVEQAEAGAVAVAGSVSVEGFDEHPPGVERAYRDQYAARADGSHSHVHGANLGVRADAYLDVGGWHRLATGEDHDLWRRLRARDHPLLSTIEAPVLTSGRRLGRAPEGFAGLLGRLGESAVDASS
jgi:glycosyltransferase involved in cell wall biosynthesis